MTEELVNGIYLMKCQDEGSLYLGEMLPKKRPGMVGVPQMVVSLPAGVRAPEWHLEKREDGNWVITTSGCPTFPMDGMVRALPMPFQNAFGWQIDAQPKMGRHVFTIRDPEEPMGWVMPAKDAYTQVAMQSFVMGGHGAHQRPFPTGALFTLIPVPGMKPLDEN